MLGSAIEYADALPKDWKIDQLGNLGTFINGYPFKPTDWRKNGRPIIRIQNLNDKTKPFNYFDDEVDRKYLIVPGDILISWSASLDAFLWKNGEAWLNQHIFKALPDEDQLDRGFFFYAMKYAMLRIATHARGSTMRHVTAKQFKQSELAFPLLPEQHRIATVLSLLQQVIEQQERLIALTTELKKTLMHKLFTEGTRGEPQKQTEIGPVPESWEVVELGTLFYKEPQNGLYKPKKDYGGGTQILRIDDFSNDGDVVARAGNRVVLSRNEIATYGLNAGDIVINRVNSLSHLGKTALIGAIGEEMVFESNMMRFSVDESKVRKEYVFKFLNSPLTKKQIIGSAKRAVAQSSINQGDVKAILIPKPSLEYQEEIAGAIEATELKIANNTTKKANLQDLFRTLLHQLMIAEKRVNDFDLEELGLDSEK